MFLVMSCLQEEKFVQEVFEYVPSGNQETIAQLRSRTPDVPITDDIYVQGYVTSTDAGGNYSGQIFFQDETGGISIVADLGSSNQLFPLGQKVSVQCKGVVLAQVRGVLQLAAGVKGEGLAKEAVPFDNRTARMTIFAVDGNQAVTPRELSLSEVSASDKVQDCCLVKIKDVFFQTCSLPFANEGGSSEQYRTLYDNTGKSILLCTSDGATIAGERLPSGKGSVTGVLTYPSGKPVIMLRSLDDIAFSPSSDTVIDDPEDVESDLLISEYYSNKGALYVEVFNVGTSTVDLGAYSLAADTGSDGNFSRTVTLDAQPLGPFGMAVYSNTAAAETVPPASTVWDPLRTNYSAISLDPLAQDGDCQIALLKDGKVVDILSTTGKVGWAADKTLIRRTGIVGHSKDSDFTRADAGWITRIGGYAYNLGAHRFFETDPDFDSPSAPVAKSILELRNMPTGVVASPIVITGRVTSDRSSGNVKANRLFMQDGSNRGICVSFKEGQAHQYNPGDEISVAIYGAEFASENGLAVIRDCFVARSGLTGAANEMPAAIEASVSQIPNLQSMYIYIKDVQVSAAEIGKTYGQGQIHSEDLFGNGFYLQTEASASFAGTSVATASGMMAGIAGVDGDKLLLRPRTTSDLAGLTLPRFEPIVAREVAASVLKETPEGVIGDDIRVTVAVTTDNAAGNMPSSNIFVQDAETGFRLQLPGANTYEFGQTLIVVLKNATLSKANGLQVTPAAPTSVVAIGAPDPSIQPVSIKPSGLEGNLCRLVTVSDVEVDESARLSRFDGIVRFNAKGVQVPIQVVTEPTAAWKGAYIPTAKGSLTGLLAKDDAGYILYPRKAEDLAGLPEEGTRIDGERVVYFVPSTDPKADLFVSQTVFGDLDANGAPLASAARNSCNSKFVEMFNPTGADIDLHNHRVACIKYNNSVNRSNITYYQFPEGKYLKPGHTLVFKYVSCALGKNTTNKNTNTIWPAGYTGDSGVTSGVQIDETAVPGVLLFLDARDYSQTIANSTKAFPSFDGNDILVVQKTGDGGTNWTEVDRVFSLPTADGTIGGKVSYPFLTGFMRKPGVLGIPGNVTDALSAEYTALNASKRNVNDFESIQCNPVSGGAANWVTVPLCDVSDLGVHSFSVK